MRIAILSVFYPFRGGISQFNGHIYRSLSQKHEVKAFNFSLQYPNFLFPGKSQYVSSDDSIDKIPNERVLNSANPLSYISTAQKINHFAPDVLIIRYWMPYFAPSLGTVARLVKSKGTKVASVIDNLIPHEQRFFDTAFTKYYLNAVDACVCMSDAVLTDVKRMAPKMPVALHPHPVYDHFGTLQPKEKAQHDLGIPKGKRVLLFFGLIRAYKGLDILLKAMKYLSEEYYLIVAGEPYEDFAPYRQLIEESGAVHRIQLHTRYIATDEVATLFSAADAGVLPYKSATQSGVAAMAFHFNLPVVVTHVGGLKEMIEPYGIGLVAEQPTTEAIVNTVEQLFDTPAQLSIISENIKQFKQKYNWHTFSNLLIESVLRKIEYEE